MRKAFVTVATLGLLMVPAIAQANPSDDELRCDPSPDVWAQPTNKNAGWPTSGGRFTATVDFSTDGMVPACEPVQYVLSTWETNGPIAENPDTSTQRLFALDRLNTRQPGNYSLSVPIPPCFWQVDFAPGLTAGQGNEIGYAEGGQTCEKPKPEHEAPDKPEQVKHKHHDRPHLGTAVHERKPSHEHGKRERFGGTAMTGTREEVIRWGLFLLVGFLVIATASLTAARERV